MARRTIDTVPAYQRHLRDVGLPADVSFDALPIVDKAGYLRLHPFADLLGEDAHDTFTIFRSAGSSGHPFYWPQLKSSYADAPRRLAPVLTGLFDLANRPTLAVVGLALGSWIGGDLLSWSLKNVALGETYPFAVFSPGNRHDEIIETIHKAGDLVDQFLLICCPSAIGHLKLLAEQSSRPLPEARLRYLVIGEPFPEQMRAEIEASAGPVTGGVRMASVYGSADTGIVGFESAASICLRQLCKRMPKIAEALGIDGVIPQFFHVSEADTFLEEIGGELCVTRWQGIPLVRYNLHDAASLFEVPTVIDTLSRLNLPGEASAAVRALTEASGKLPPGLVAISGRADATLNLCGTKLSEAMLDEAVNAPDLVGRLTGTYQAKVIVEDTRQRLRLLVELRAGLTPSEDLLRQIYPALVQALGRVQPEFLDDWQNIYRRWDDNLERRILKLDLVPWPALSKDLETGIKKHGLVT